MIYSEECKQPLMSDLRQQLPRIAKYLETQKDEIVVYECECWPREFAFTDCRDKAIRFEGSLPDMPYVHKKRPYDKGPLGYGIVIYESRLTPSIKYAIYNYRGPDWEENYICVRKQDVFKLNRNAIRQAKNSSEKNLIPILPDGLLEDMVQNTVGFLSQANEISHYGVKIKRGIIIDGPPGNGKTMLCRYIQKLCTKNGIKWGTITSADIDGAYQDKDLNRLFTMYNVAFFDDIDISYMDRNGNNAKLACSLLTAMDGMNETENLVRIFTTNESVDKLDSAFVRPGRIDKCVTLNKPTRALREKLVTQVWPSIITDFIDIEDLIQKTDDYSFAEMEAIRTLLVTNFVLGDKIWDLDKALSDLNEEHPDTKKTPKVGFKI